MKKALHFDIEKGEWILRKEPRHAGTYNVSLTQEEFNQLKEGKISRIHVKTRNLTLKIHVKPFMVEKARNKGHYILIPYSEKSPLMNVVKRQPQTIPGFVDRPFWDQDVSTETTEDIGWISKLKAWLKNI